MRPPSRIRRLHAFLALAGLALGVAFLIGVAGASIPQEGIFAGCCLKSGGTLACHGAAGVFTIPADTGHGAGILTATFTGTGGFSQGNAHLTFSIFAPGQGQTVDLHVGWAALSLVPAMQTWTSSTEAAETIGGPAIRRGLPGVRR